MDFDESYNYLVAGLRKMSKTQLYRYCDAIASRDFQDLTDLKLDPATREQVTTLIQRGQSFERLLVDALAKD